MKKEGGISEKQEKLFQIASNGGNQLQHLVNQILDLGKLDVEQNEGFTVSLSSPANGSITTATATGTIYIGAVGVEQQSTPPSPLDNGSTWQTSNTFTGLAAGSYNLKVRLQDSPACMTTFTGNPVGLIAVSNCDPAKSLDFDGTNDYVALPANLTASLTNFIFEALVFWDGSSAWQRIMDFGSGTSTFMFLTPNADITFKPRFAINNGGGEQVINSSVSAIPNPPPGDSQ